MLSLPKFTTISSPDHPVINPFKGFKKFYSGHYFISEPSVVFVNYIMSDTLRIPEEKGLLNVKITNYNADESVEDFYNNGTFANWKETIAFLEENKTKEINYISIYYEYITITNKIYRWKFNLSIDFNTGGSMYSYEFDMQGDDKVTGFRMIRQPDTIDNLSNIYTKQEMDSKYIQLTDKRIQESNIIKAYPIVATLEDGSRYSIVNNYAYDTPFYYKLNADQSVPIMMSDGRPDISYITSNPVDIIEGDFNGYRNSFYINSNMNYLAGVERFGDFILTLGHYNNDSSNGKKIGYVGVKLHHSNDTVSVFGPSSALMIHKPYGRDKLNKTLFSEPISPLATKVYAQSLQSRQNTLISNLNNAVHNYRLSAVISHEDGIGKYTSYNERAITTGFRVVSTGTRTLTTTGVWRYSRVIQYYKNGWRELGQ